MREQADCFKALGDVTRLQVLMMLADGEKCACDIQENFALKQPTISHHMKILQQAGLVLSEKRGKWIYYGLNSERFEELKHFIAENMIRTSGYPYRLADHDCGGTR